MAWNKGYLGKKIRTCDNDSSYARAVLGGGGGCFKGKPTKKVIINQGFAKDELELCDECAKKISAHARRYGAEVTIRSLR